MSSETEEEKKAPKTGDRRKDGGNPKKAADERKAAKVGVEGLFADKKDGEDEERQRYEEGQGYYKEYRKQEEIFEENRSSYAESYLFNDEDIKRLAEEADVELRKREMAYYRDTDKIVQQIKRTQGGEEALQLLLKLTERGTGNIPEEVTEKILSSQSGEKAAKIIEEWRRSSMTDIIQKGFKDWEDFQRRNLAFQRVRDMKRIRLDHRNPEDISRRIEAIDVFLEDINDVIYGHRPPGMPAIISKEWADYVSNILSEIRTQIKYEGGSYAKYLDSMLHRAMEGGVDEQRRSEYSYSDQQHTKHLDPKFKKKIERINVMLAGLDYIEDLDEEHERLWSRNKAVEEELRR